MITIDSYIYIEAARLYRVSLLPGASIGERLLLLLLLPFEVLPDAFDECVVNRVCQSCVRMCVCVCACRTTGAKKAEHVDYSVKCQ